AAWTRAAARRPLGRRCVTLESESTSRERKRGREPVLIPASHQRRDRDRRREPQGLRELGRDVGSGPRADTGRRAVGFPPKANGRPEADDDQKKDDEVDDDGDGAVLDEDVLESLSHAMNLGQGAGTSVRETETVIHSDVQQTGSSACCSLLPVTCSLRSNCSQTATTSRARARR